MPDMFTIGFLSPTHGRYRAIGRDGRRCTALALEEAHASGGRSVQPIGIDPHANPQAHLALDGFEANDKIVHIDDSTHQHLIPLIDHPSPHFVPNDLAGPSSLAIKHRAASVLCGIELSPEAH